MYGVCKCHKTALTTAGVVFAIVALAHVARLVHPFEVVVDGHSLPEYGSAIGLVVFGFLSYWMFSASCKKK